MTRGRRIRFVAVSSAILCALGMGSRVSAQTLPVITGVSGTAQQGATLTISGSGFGTKGVAAPMRWDNFESGTPGALYTGPYFRDDNEVTFSNTVLRTNSTRSVQCAFVNGDYATNFGIVGVNNLNHLYIDAWYYYRAASPPSRNHKLFRIHANTYTPNLYFNVYCDNATHMDQDGSGSGKTDTWPAMGGTGYLRDKWTHLQGYFEMSSANTNDGTALLWVDNVLWVNFPHAWNTTPNSTSYWSDFYFGNYLGHDASGTCGPSGDAYTFWDNCYVDTTQAHVEIGNMATYAACTLREIQVPTRWTPTSIDVTVNQGALANLSNGYLYVFNRNGLVNAVGIPPCTSCPPPVLDTTPPAAVNSLVVRPGP